MLGLHAGSVVSADILVELLWGEDPPRTAAKALQTHISALRRTLGDGFVLTDGTGWTLAETRVDASRYRSAARLGRDAAAAGDTSQAVARFEEALALWRGIPELPDGRRGTSEKTRWIEGHAALVEDRADALLATGRAAEIVGELEAAVAEAPLRERRWGQLMLALYRAGRQGEALGAYQRARALLADELGVDPGPELRRLEAAIVAQDAALEVPAAQQVTGITRAVTFLLTDIEGSTAAWEADAGAMAVALARHDELVEQVVTSRGGRLIKTRGEGDATFSVFERPSAAAAAAIELQEAIVREPWALRDPMRVRVALHTGEAELRDGDYFGRAVNRAARLRSLAAGGQILCSGATAELVIDSLADDVVLADLGMRELRNLARPEHVFELRLETADDRPQPVPTDMPLMRPSLPAVLTGPGPFVGRGPELERLFSAWQTALAGGTNAVLIAGEPGVGKTRLAGEWSRLAYDQGALVIYGRCDEDLGAPYQPFAEALRALVPCLGADALRGLRGVEALLPLVPGLADVLPDLAAPTRADPDTERYALFDAVVAVLSMASAHAPVALILDDLHWAAKPTLLLLRHLLRFGEQARVQVIGTYRSTDLDRAHPLSAMLADLHRSAGSGTANRLQLAGLDEGDVTAYVAQSGYDDEELARALASVTGGNPFFLIEALRHVEESGGRWDPSTLPQGVREAVSRRLSRLAAETNKALAAAAVVGSRFALELVERVVGDDLVDAFDEAGKAGIVIEEPGGRYRFNHALIRQSLLAELPSVRRMRLHQRIAATLENEPGAGDELLAELAHHYFECAWAGNAAKAVEYCRRAADQAMARLAYEGAADLYDDALHALEEIDDELPDREDQVAELLVARCEALLAAGDVASAAGAVSELQSATVNSARLAAWATCFDGQLSMLIHPERLDEIEAALGAAAEKLAGLDDAAGEAKAHTVRAVCLARLGRIGDCEVALDDALTAARRAREHRRVNAVLAGAPLAALWGPNPVPRAGGRCLDVVRLLRITTDSPAVEATSTRCQAVLEAFRGRAAAARRMIDSARRTVTELGLRHALFEVEQFAGIVELVVDDPVAAEAHLRQAYNGFRRMGLDADTAETAAILGRACLALGRVAEADELCAESERLAGHALKASIAWRTLRAQLLARSGDHAEARRVAEAAVSLAERTDALVDHGDACLTLATVLGAAGDAAGARAAASRAVDLYERKGAGALAEKARGVLGERDRPVAPAPPEAPVVELENECVRVNDRLIAAIHCGAWDVVEEMYAREGFAESRRKIVGFAPVPSADWAQRARRVADTGTLRFTRVVIAVRGERLALVRTAVGTAEGGPGSPQDEFLAVLRIDEEGRIALQVWFDVEDLDTAMAELDAAHARLEEERPKARRLENAATRVIERFLARLAAGDWPAIAELYAEDVCTDDRRRVVAADVLHGREANVANWRVLTDIAPDNLTSTTIAVRGEHLTLTRIHSSAFQIEVLNLLEVDADERIKTVVVFELDDFEAALAELDARYLAGEAAAHAQTWSALLRAFAAFNRRELPATTPDWVNIDHRRGRAFSPGELIPYISATWEVAPQARIYVESVHRLSNLGAVVTQSTRGTSPAGFDVEWLEVTLLTMEGDLMSRCEVFDEEEIGAAIAKFERLNRPAPRLENEATRVFERVWPHYAARDWDELTRSMAANYCVDDRRRVVNAGVRHGRDAEINDLRAAAEVGFTINMVGVIAIRGQRLALVRVRASGRDPDASQDVALNVVEIDDDSRIAAAVVFDLGDFDAAIAELDARYLSGEAAAHAATWSAITRGYGAFNRREGIATTADWVNIDHRRAVAVAPGELTDYVHAAWDLEQDVNIYIEAVHRLSNLGAVVTHATYATSREGFEAEWRMVLLVTVQGDLVNYCEVFDDEDLAGAIARFEQLNRPTSRLENTASQVAERFLELFDVGDWDAIAEVLADDFYAEDHRRVVGGVRNSRDVELASIRAGHALGGTKMTSTVIATRGARLILTRTRYSGPNEAAEGFLVDVLAVIEINGDNRIAARIVFELDDIDAAFEELDARYLACEAAAHAQTWSVITRAYAALNRRELPSTTPDWVNIDHRRGTSFESGEMPALLDAAWNHATDLRHAVEAVHRLNKLGAVVTSASHETSQDGTDAEWRVMTVVTVDGDMLSRCEIFDEADLDAAIARFDELSSQTRRLENTASRAVDRYVTLFAARDWDALAKVLTDDMLTDDRRRVANAGTRHGRKEEIANLRAVADVVTTDLNSVVVAVRGERLVLTRMWGCDRQSGEFLIELLAVVEINAHDQIAVIVLFDLDDSAGAIAELDARYLAGEAAPHEHTWSVIARAYAAANRNELPPTTADWATIDHRRGRAFGPGELAVYMRATWDVIPDTNVYVEFVHRLSNVGAVVTHAVRGTSREGFDADWREVAVLMVDGGRFSRSELFDEADLDAAIARFDQLSRPESRLENAASQVAQRLFAYFAARDWDAMAAVMADNASHEDRRHVVNAGLMHGRDAQIANARAIAEVGIVHIASTVIAIRGARLALIHTRSSVRDQPPETALSEELAVVELDPDNRMAAYLTFDANDFEAAIGELDARYLTGEAAAHSHTWSAIMGVYAALNRRELPLMTPDWVDVDRRRLATIEAGGMKEYLSAMLDTIQNVSVRVEAVHRLSNLGAVVTHAAHGTSQEGFDAEWRVIDILTFEGDLVSRSEMFDEADLDAAIARFDELDRRTRRLENAASRVAERFFAYFGARDWDAIATTLAETVSHDDRRHVVNAGVLHGRDAQIANLRAIAEVGVANFSSTAIATRGARLALLRTRSSGRDQRPEGVLTEELGVVEINSDNRMVAYVAFDPNDVDAAFEELDARYLAGEAGAHARTWAVISEGCAALNRHELPRTTADFASIDHRRAARYAPGELIEYVRAGWDLDQNIRTYVEVVHRLGDTGAVYTHSGHGISREGFAAEWRGIDVVTVNGDMVNRCETFDEADLDAALARFDELHPQTRRLENAASKAYERFRTYFAARDWVAMAELLTADTSVDDHRRVVNAEIRRGREVEIANMRAFADIGVTTSTATVIATRGERLVLCRTCISSAGHQSGGFHIEMLIIVETSADERIMARVAYDPDDIEAAFTELDARYLAGEAAPHANTWSVITRAYAAVDRHELPPTTPDWVNVDRRRGIAFAPGELGAYLQATWDVLTPDIQLYVETVHRLSDLGAVVTRVAKGTSREGFEAEWREIGMSTVVGDLINRSEVFDESELDAALARFEELHAQAPRIENAASHVTERFWMHFAARDWDAMAELTADNVCSDDRRRVVNGGVRHGREAHIADMRVIAEVVDPRNLRPTVIASRGARLALCHIRSSNRAVAPHEISAEVLSVVEIDADNRILAHIGFDVDDIDAAFTELDARYLAGEAAAHAHVWSVIARECTAFNRHELPAADWVTVDHRQLAVIDATEGQAAMRAIWEVTPNLSMRILAVHRLSSFGAVASYAASGTSPGGLDVEWPMVLLLTVDGDGINRCEVFDEADVDAALARFEELQPQPPRLENAASQVTERFWKYYAARDWNAMTQSLADDIFSDDRRRVVNAGLRRGRDDQLADMRALAEIEANITTIVIAIRGERLVLTRVCSSNHSLQHGEFGVEMLVIVETGTDERISAHVIFDVDDLDAAIEELDARYLAGEAAAHADTWSVIAESYARFNRHQLPATTPDPVYIDHRPLVSIEGADLAASFRALWDLTSEVNVYVEAVHRLNEIGAVITQVVKGTWQEGSDAELRMIGMFTVDGNLISRAEVFDEADLDVALTNFEELHRHLRVKNATSHAAERFGEHFAARDWGAMAETLAADVLVDDRRRGINAGTQHGRNAAIEDLRASVDAGFTHATSTVIATRGSRLGLARVHFSEREHRSEAFGVHALHVIEVNADGETAAVVVFDIEDTDAAFRELDARYLAGEAAAHARTWSVTAQAYAAVNRQELPPTTPDWINVDHRRGRGFAPGDLAAYLSATWDMLAPPVTVYIETVHRLSDPGAVVTHVVRGTSHQGFDAEWREITISMVRGSLIERSEMFDETDLDAALARFAEFERSKGPGGHDQA